MAIIDPQGKPTLTTTAATNPLDLFHLASTGLSPIIIGVYLAIQIYNAVNALLLAIYAQQTATATLLSECTKALAK